MKISLLGAPGSGKGTQAKLLSEYYDIAHISTGELFRRAISQNTPLGKKIEKYMSTLVPDDIVIDLVKERIKQDDCKNGYILDGFPRNLNQAKLFEEFDKFDYVVYLSVDKDEVVKRISNRLTCVECGSIYMQSQTTNNICTQCGGKLEVRQEDKNIDRRINTYISQTLPLVEYFDKKGTLLTINDKDVYDKDPDKCIQLTFNKVKEYIGESND